MENIFEIKNLKCAYHQDKVVLEVKHLEIPFGKIVFVVGESGIGKSTILETLGLMNNTIVSDSTTVFNYYSIYDSKSSEKTFICEDIIKLWNEKSDKKLSTFRLKNFSFIFQLTNLMRNFTAYENIAITSMLQGKTKAESITKTIKALCALGLEEIDHTREVNALSGGQQQRLSFARAIVPDFSVLFGDEPTGNLDPVTAEIVMDIMRKELKGETNENKCPTEIDERKYSSAIIVSHAIDLALQFADIIIKIHSVPREEDPKKNYGVIDEHSVFEKCKKSNKWTSTEGEFNHDDLLKKLKYNGTKQV